MALRDVADYRAGTKIDPASISETAWLLDLEEVEKDSGRILKFCTCHEKASTSTKAAFVAGDVLYGKLRPYLNKVVVAPKAGFCTTEIVPIRSRGSVTPEYLCLFLRSPGFVRYATSKSYGMKMPRLGTADAEAAEIPLPPLAEQKRIVAKVDELMALCDRLEAQQQERETRHAALARASLARFAEAPTPANLEFLFHNAYAIPPADLRKSILTLAVQGKLVPQDLYDEPADVLLMKLGQRRAMLSGDRVIRVAKEVENLSGDAPYQIPATWRWASLGVITEVSTGSTPSRTDPAFWRDGTIPWVTSGSTSQSPITSGDAFVTPAAIKAHRLRLYPPGTLLVAMYGQGKTRGQVAVLEISATINQACAAICPLDGTQPMQGYLKLLLQKQYDEMRSLAAGGAQPNLNVQKIKDLSVPLPPLAEQRRIVAKVDELMALVDKLEAELASARTTATNLLAAAVAELTTGKEPLSA